MENIIFLFEEKVINGALSLAEIPQTVRAILQKKTDEGGDINVSQSDSFSLVTEWNGKKLEYIFSGFSLKIFYGNEYDTFDFATMPNGFSVESIETDLPFNPFLYVTKSEDTLRLKLLKIRKG